MNEEEADGIEWNEEEKKNECNAQVYDMWIVSVHPFHRLWSIACSVCCK